LKATRNNFVKGLKNEKDPLSVGKDEYVDALNIRIESDEGGSSYSVINVKGNRHDTTIPDVPPMVVITPNFDEIEDATLPLSTSPVLTINGNLITGAAVYANDRSALVLFRQLQNAFETDPVFAAYNLQVTRQGLRIVITSQTDTVTPALGSRLILSTAVAGLSSDSQIIIGWAHSDQTFYIMTTNDRSDVGGHGAIWKLTYDVVNFTYTWNIRYSSPDLMLTTKHPIPNPTGIEVSNEGEDIVRLAWTDNHNPLRFLSVESPNSLAITIGMLGVHDGQTNPIPVFKDVLTGGSLKNGTYQIAYRLRADDASCTLISQHSNVINLTEDAEHALVHIDSYEGSYSDDAQSSGKALTFLFNVSDTAYSFLEIFTLFRNTHYAVPEVRLVSEVPIYDRVVEYTISGAEESATFTYEELQNLYAPFTHCKTISEKDNILFAGNVRSDDFDVEFDARAYGHKSVQQGGGSYVTTPQEVYPADETLDVINPDPDEYKYQSNGITYGGEGPNVKYKFTSRYHRGDSYGYQLHNNDPGHLGHFMGFGIKTPAVTVGRNRFMSTWEPPADDVTIATANGLGSGGQTTYEGMMTGHISPWEAANWRGYKRGEVYRFAFVPIKNGQEGRAKWIADIKIPHYTDKPDDQVDYWWKGYQIVKRNPAEDSRSPTINPIGVSFDIDVSSIAGEIDGYKIKRVKREDKDKTILGSGILGLTATRFSSDFPGAYLDIRTKFGLSGVGLADRPEYMGAGSYWFGAQVSVEGNNDDREGSSNHEAVLYSPDMCFKESFDFRGGDEIRIHSILHPTIQDGVLADSSWSQANSVYSNHHYGLDVYTGANKEKGNTQVSKLYGQLDLKQTFLDQMDPNNLPKGISEEDLTNGYITVKLEDAQICEYGASVEFSDGKKFHNRTYKAWLEPTNGVGSLQKGLGAKCLALKLTKGITYMADLVREAPSGYNTLDLPYIHTRLVAAVGDLHSMTGNVSNLSDTQVRRYVDYYRPLQAQYGGNSYAARSKNTYIDTGTYVEVKDSDTIKSAHVFGGDTYINIFNVTTLTRNINSWLATGQDRADMDGKFRKSYNLTEFFPVESSINTDLRQGYYYEKSYQHFDLPGEDWQFSWNADSWETVGPGEMLATGESFIYNFAYSNEQDLQPSFPPPLAGEELDIFPTRIYASDVKTIGEVVDSWRRFRTQSYIEVNSAYGPINSMVNNLDRIIVLQDDAIGTASVNERQIAQSQSAEAVILGNSGILPRFDYITRHTGSRHQFGIVMSPNSMYFYDVSDGVLYRFDGKNVTPISQVGELNQLFYNNFRGELLRNDNPIHDADVDLNAYNPLGITGTYDYRFNEVLFTFHTYLNGQYVAKTFAFNENGSTFTSFYSFTPTVYLNDRDNIFSPGKPDQNTLGTPNPQQHKLYIHNKGERGVFYDQAPADSYVEMIVNAGEPSSKIFTNLEWNSEVYDSAGNNTPGDTVDSITISNEYQTLPVLTTYQRRFRTWRATIPREVTNRARLRGHYMRMRYTFNNSDNRKFVLSGVTTIYDMTAY